jgi:peptidoglycan/xylan/chitin deacetylase (PgdA/CDA1 family)
MGRGLPVRRRTFLEALAGSVVLALAGCTDKAVTSGSTADASVSTAAPTVVAAASGAASSIAPPSSLLFHPPVGLVRVPLPAGTLTALPGQGNLVALTVDDGICSEVVEAYAMLAIRTGLRLTFFANGSVPSWTEHAPLLRPLIESGQATIGNHTWSHPDLTALGDAGIRDEVQRNEQFLLQTYGITGRPFVRPPFGYHTPRVDRVLNDLGYPAITMWYGSLGDSTVLTPARIVSNAEKWLLPQHLVIGHANHTPVMDVLDQIADIIHARGLQPVHLAELFEPPTA